MPIVTILLGLLPGLLKNLPGIPATVQTIIADISGFGGGDHRLGSPVPA